MSSKPWTRSDYHSFIHVFALKTDLERQHYLRQTRDIVRRQIHLIYATMCYTLVAKWSGFVPHAEQWIQWLFSASGIHDIKLLHQLLWMDAELVVRYAPWKGVPPTCSTGLVSEACQLVAPEDVSPDWLYAFTLRYYAPAW